jgi:hypothetical protein
MKKEKQSELPLCVGGVGVFFFYSSEKNKSGSRLEKRKKKEKPVRQSSCQVARQFLGASGFFFSRPPAYINPDFSVNSQ